jgi:hypothetical protein
MKQWNEAGMIGRIKGQTVQYGVRCAVKKSTHQACAVIGHAAHSRTPHISGGWPIASTVF